MGEIADMMLEGLLCEGCGEAFDDVVDGADAPGFPRRCPTCSPITPRGGVLGRSNTSHASHTERNRARKARNRAADKPHRCSCGKLCRTADGLKAHQYAKHGLGEW